jgi:LPXTG-site transpeptidase (sortase) family protein
MSPRQRPRWADPRAIGLLLAVVAAVVVVVTIGSLPRGAIPASGAAASTTLQSPTAPTSQPTLAATATSMAPSRSPGPAGNVAVRVVIPRLGIDLPIVEGDGMAAPMGEAAHFPGTAWPDAHSNTYIYAHAQEGMFLPLWNAKVGDEVRLTLRDSQQRCFRVSEVIPKVPWNDTSYLLPTPDERLTLQTSTSYTPTAPRFVVIALPCR